MTMLCHSIMVISLGMYDMTTCISALQDTVMQRRPGLGWALKLYSSLQRFRKDSVDTASSNACSAAMLHLTVQGLELLCCCPLHCCDLVVITVLFIFIKFNTVLCCIKPPCQYTAKQDTYSQFTCNIARIATHPQPMSYVSCTCSQTICNIAMIALTLSLCPLHIQKVIQIPGGNIICISNQYQPFTLTADTNQKSATILNFTRLICVIDGSLVASCI